VKNAKNNRVEVGKQISANAEFKGRPKADEYPLRKGFGSWFLHLNF
jgi:hypothetical protein